MTQHLVLAPILIPLITGAALLLLERRHDSQVLRTGAWIGMALLLASVLALVARASQGGIDVYLMGDWPARLGIVLMLDRLSALMVLTTTLLAIPCLLYACAGWDKRALHFHSLFQIQLAGLNGAFLTGDIFNLSRSGRRPSAASPASPRHRRRSRRRRRAAGSSPGSRRTPASRRSPWS